MNHIGIVGLRHSGKTTLAKEILKQGHYARLALADPLKNDAVSMLNIFLDRHNLPHIDREILERDKAKLRPFLQLLGTEIAREYIGPDDFWINQFEREVAHAEYLGYSIVCDDVRLPNEAERLRKLGFLIVKISRDEGERQKSLSLAGDTSENHSSETNIPLIEADVYLNKVPHDRIAECVSFMLDPGFSPTYPVSLWHDSTENVLWGVEESRKDAAIWKLAA